MNRLLQNWNIRQKMLVLAVIPLVLITSLLSGYFIWSRQADMEAYFIQMGSGVSQYLVSASEFPMVSGDIDSLKNLAQASLTEQDVIVVIYYDTDKSVLLHQGESVSPSLTKVPIHRNGHYWSFQRPITSTAIEVDDFELPDSESTIRTATTTNLGWVQVILSDKRLRQEQHKAIFTGISIAGTVLILAILMALRLGRGITRPLSKLSKTVQELETGNLAARAPDLDGNEFHILVHGLNRMAEHIEHANEELKQRVDEATGQLKETLRDLEQRNQELEQTRQELITADHAKDEFLARMSHELRTPLTSVLGYSKLLDDLGLTAQQQEFNHVIKQSSDLLLSVINDLLDFAKLRSNAVQLEQIAFNLETCLEDLVTMHAHGAFDKGLELVLLIESDVPIHVIGDQLRLRQIVNNLLSNAIKFTHQGEVVITVSMADQSDESVTLVIQVKDSGIGIKKEDREHLFREFSQADSSITRRFGGSGLGLVISKRLANLMHGDIELISISGTGTEAVCSVQLALDKHLKETRTSIPSRTERVLIYDSHPWALRELRHQALKWTTQTVSTSKVELLISKIENSDTLFDALIIGLNQVQLKQHELISLLDRVRNVSAAPILLVGGVAILPLKNNEAKWSEYQPIDFISKPARSSHFTKHLTALVSGDFSTIDVEATDTDGIDDTTTGQTLLGANIIIAEDNDYNRQLIGGILESLGAKVIPTSNGREAVEACKNHQVDIVLMDLNMPEMDGYEAVAWIKASAHPKDSLPVIALTAATPQSGEDHTEMLLFDAVLEKPIDQDNFVSTLLNCWGKRKLPPSPAKSDNRPLIQVSEEALHNEINRLMVNLTRSVVDLERPLIRNYAHQLLGVINRKHFGEIAEIASHIERLALESPPDILNDYFEQLLSLVSQHFNR